MNVKSIHLTLGNKREENVCVCVCERERERERENECVYPSVSRHS